MTQHKNIRKKCVGQAYIYLVGKRPLWVSRYNSFLGFVVLYVQGTLRATESGTPVAGCLDIIFQEQRARPNPLYGGDKALAFENGRTHLSPGPCTISFPRNRFYARGLVSRTKPYIRPEPNLR